MNAPDTLKRKCRRSSSFHARCRAKKISGDIVGGDGSRIKTEAGLVCRDGEVIRDPRDGVIQWIDKCENHWRAIINGAEGADAGDTVSSRSRVTESQVDQCDILHENSQVAILSCDP